MMIVVTFVLCHLLRVLLNLHELSILQVYIAFTSKNCEIISWGEGGMFCRIDRKQKSSNKLHLCPHFLAIEVLQMELFGFFSRFDS